MRWGAVLLLSGCARIFNLEHVDDSRLDAPTSDAASDARKDAVVGDAFDPGTQCPGYPLTIHPSARYRTTTTYKTAVAASDECAGDINGVTHLAVIDSKEEFDAMRAALGAGNELRWWVGAFQPKTATTPDADWIWVTGEPVTGPLWHTNEPNDEGDGEQNHGEQVAFLEMGLQGMVDTSVGTQVIGLCECDGRGMPQSAVNVVNSLR